MNGFGRLGVRLGRGAGVAVGVAAAAATAFLPAGCGSGEPPAADVSAAASPDAAPDPAQASTPAPAAGNAGEFAGPNFRPAPRDAAEYRLERVFQEPVMIVSGVPTFDQGLMMRAEQTPLDRYVFRYRRLDDGSLAFTVETTVLRDAPSQYTFSGAGVWYDRAGNPTAKGTFESGALHGVYQELDADGRVIGEVLYDRGEAYDPNRFAGDTHRPLLGRWVSTTTDDSSGVTRRLINDYRDDGTMAIWNERVTRSAFSDSGPMLLGSSDPTELSYIYKPGPGGEGHIEYYSGRELFARSRVAFPGPDRMDAAIVYHQSPSLVGTRYGFEREPAE